MDAGEGDSDAGCYETHSVFVSGRRGLIFGFGKKPSAEVPLGGKRRSELYPTQDV
jgi:hypothetical protein